VRTVAAGAVYFALVFLVGVALGVLRNLWLVPALGAGPALLIELPVILGIAWHVCRCLTRLLSVSGGVPARLVMGAVALLLLIGTETLLAATWFGSSVAQHVASYETPVGAAGLLAQLAFAGFPFAQRKRF
jgi:hypothetical protein